MMKKIIFITGFPGFLGTEIIKKKLTQHSESIFLLLVQDRFLELANQTCLKIKQDSPPFEYHLITSDITAPNLGINQDKHLKWIESITEIFHFAAVYDLEVPHPVGMKINVVGTENTIEFAKSCPKLKRFHYVSTCYVSGQYQGTFLESDLERDQKFNNFYEETKYRAEVRVQKEIENGFPATVYRPAVVVGHSKTGETAKYDGPYFLIQWMLRFPMFALVPQLGDSTKHTLNAVPSDFVIDALSYLSDRPDTLGKTFHLADPNPLTIEKMSKILARNCGRKLILIPLSLSFAKWVLQTFPWIQRYLGIPAATLNYFTHPTTYDTRFTQTYLQQGGIQCPHFETYSQLLVLHMKKEPNLRTKAMI